MSIEAGTQVWVKTDGGDEDWAAAEVLRSEAKGSKTIFAVREEKSQVERSVEAGAGADGELVEVKLRNVGGQSALEEGSGVEDLIGLTHLHEPSILYTLRERYAAGDIYTYTGAILLAVNPFYRINIYGEAKLAEYQREGAAKVASPDFEQTLAPHAYAIADNAYNAMAHPKTQSQSGGDTGVNQSILVSGESGAGKTETTKIIMSYLATVAGAAEAVTSSSRGGKRRDSGARQKRRSGEPASPAALLGDGGGGENSEVVEEAPPEPLEKQVVQCNPILEAFGNARTVRNDNSSRFGKFIEIQFDKKAKLAGAQVRTFLLEKVRLVRQSEGERNYHVFYLLAAGANAEERQEWRLKGDSNDSDDPSNGLDRYLYTSQSNCFDRRDGALDNEEYELLRDAMETMRFPPEDVDGCLICAAAVLALGELEFEGVDDGATQGGAARIAQGGGGNDDDDNGDNCENAAQLLGVQPEALEGACTCRTIKARGESFTMKLNPQQAADSRDGLAKALYTALFEWVVNRVNTSIKVAKGVKPHSFIGLLDIFGFESFKHNGFEQFLINYCNEVLQQQFNAFVFEAEQAEYAAEQILWSFVEFPDNKQCIEMIEVTKPAGILSLLDEQTMFPNATDATFCAKLHAQIAPSHKKHFGTSPELKVSQCFVVHHYAGSIRYSSDGFLEKNRDKLYGEGLELLSGSFRLFVRGLMSLLTGEGGDSSSPGGGSALEAAAAAPSGGGPRGRRASVAGTSDVTARPRGGSVGARRRGSVGSSAGGGGGEGKQVSTCTQFKDSLRDLVAQIGLTSPHYVRCLKPNDSHKPHAFDAKRITEQLRYGGVLEAVRVARAGFPVRMLHAEFITRYGRLAPTAVATARQKHKSSSSSAANCAIARALLIASLPDLEAYNAEIEFLAAQKAAANASSGSGVPTDAARNMVKTEAVAKAKAEIESAEGNESAFKDLLGKVGLQLGTTKTFFRQRAFTACEALNAATVAKAAIKVQALVRSRQAHQQWRRVLKRCLVLQCWQRQRLAMRQTVNLRRLRAVLLVQRQVRRMAQRKSFQASKTCCLVLQSIVRMRPQRLVYLKQRRERAAVKLQACLSRGTVARRQWSKVRQVALWVTAQWRGRIGRKAARQKKREARSTAALQQQVHTFQAIMKESEEARLALEARANEALQLLEAAEANSQALRQQNTRYRKELASRAEAEEASSAALQALRAKNDQLVLELGRVENDALAASASAAAVAELEQRVAEHAALLSIAEAKVAEAQPAAEAAWEKVGGGGGGDNTLDDIMDDYEEGDDDDFTGGQGTPSSSSNGDGQGGKGRAGGRGRGGGRSSGRKLAVKKPNSCVRDMSQDSVAAVKAAAQAEAAAAALRAERDALTSDLAAAAEAAKKKEEELRAAEEQVELLRDEKGTLEASARSDASRAQHESELAAQNDSLRADLAAAEARMETARAQAAAEAEARAAVREEKARAEMTALAAKAEEARREADAAHEAAKASQLMSLGKDDAEAIAAAAGERAFNAEREAAQARAAAAAALATLTKEREELSAAQASLELRTLSVAEADELKAANEALKSKVTALQQAAEQRERDLIKRRAQEARERKARDAQSVAAAKSASKAAVYFEAGGSAELQAELVRGMPTAMCHICHARIPLDEIDDHAERCESSLSEGQGESPPRGENTTSSVVTVLPSNAATDKFKITVFTEVNPGNGHEGSADDVLRSSSRSSEPTSQQSPSSVVERSEGRIAALHATLENDLNGYKRDHSTNEGGNGNGNGNGNGSGSSSSKSSSAASSSAASAAQAAGLLMGGLSNLNLFGTSTMSPAAAAAPKEEPAVANPFLSTQTAAAAKPLPPLGSPDRLPDLPNLKSADRGNLCRQLERYFMALLEVNHKWERLASQNGSKGGASSHPEQHSRAHRTLMAFLETPN